MKEGGLKQLLCCLTDPTETLTKNAASVLSNFVSNERHSRQIEKFFKAKSLSTMLTYTLHEENECAAIIMWIGKIPENQRINYLNEIREQLRGQRDLAVQNTIIQDISKQYHKP